MKKKTETNVETIKGKFPYYYYKTPEYFFKFLMVENGTIDYVDMNLRESEDFLILEYKDNKYFELFTQIPILVTTSSPYDEIDDGRTMIEYYDCPFYVLAEESDDDEILGTKDLLEFITIIEKRYGSIANFQKYFVEKVKASIAVYKKLQERFDDYAKSIQEFEKENETTLTFMKGFQNKGN